jgi:hypothetical protein
MSDRPRLRPLQPFPIVENGQRYLGLRDPTGLSDAVARLPPALVAVVQLCDGETTRDEICREFEQKYKSKLPREALDHFLDQLDQALLLDSERFQQHCSEVFGEFDRSDVRAAHLAGRSYPPDADALTELLDGYFDAPDGPGRPGPLQGALPRAIVAPHIDFHRGGPAYAHAYRGLAESVEAPELVVVFGTDHHGAEHPFTLTRKHYDTPLGRIDTDLALVWARPPPIACSPASATTGASTRSSSRWSGCATSWARGPTGCACCRSCAARCTTWSSRVARRTATPP